MPLSIGRRLGPYEVLAPLGAGGMGEVYRARDTRLGREVAVKVLPEHLSAHPEVRARFEREAKTISSLNHPHICALYDVGHDEGVDYLVMELVEGETLAERLKRGRLPAEQVLRLGAEIADALDRAHRSGIVHRDLKPGNIMLAKAGVKLLDFGLARAALSAAASVDLSSTPTLTRPLTTEGTIVGTFQYMAPEQLEGKEVDARADIWALGAVLYEMATGKKAFEGASQASLIGAIMNKEPAPVSSLTPEPPGLDRVVSRCLAKDPDERWQTARDVGHELRWIAGQTSQSGAPAVVAPRRRPREPLAWAIAGVAGIAALSTGIVDLERPAVEPSTLRFSLAVAGAKSIEWPRISPDGRTLAFQAADSTGKIMIWVRPLNSLTAVPLPETEGAGRPFWSPDSRFLGFFMGNQLKKVPVAGGPPQLICDVRGGADGSWGSRGVIVFDGAQGDSIRQVSAEGGEASAATTLARARGDLYHAWPCFLPDGRHFLYLAFGKSREDTRLEAGSLGSPKTVDLGRVQTRVDYAPEGYVLFASEGTLMARPFDARALRFTGEPFPVAERVRCAPGDRANLSVSRTGILAFMPGVAAANRELVWVDRTGKTLSTVGVHAAYNDPALSPDGTRLAYSVTDPESGNDDIWVRDLKRDVASKLTFDPGNEIWPAWSPDGSRIAYASDARGPFALVQRLASGAGGVDTLYHSLGSSGPSDWSRDGRWLTFMNFDAGHADLWALSLSGDHRAQPLLKSQFTTRDPVLSPDGKWLAYFSNESGHMEVYVQPFPGPGGKWQISTNGGVEPRWRGDGKELYYLTPDNELMAVPVSAGATFEAGIPVKLFEHALPPGPGTRNRYVPTADGKRFLLVAPVESPAAETFTVVLDWTAEARKR